MRIGSVQLPSPFAIAPMAGMTDTAFRRLVKRKGGCGLVVTEMVSSEGLVRGIDRTLEYAEYTEEERPVSIQIFGGDPSKMAAAAHISLPSHSSFGEAEAGRASVRGAASGCSPAKEIPLASAFRLASSSPSPFLENFFCRPRSSASLGTPNQPERMPSTTVVLARSVPAAWAEHQRRTLRCDPAGTTVLC